jgi:photoactive yellow protein
MHLDDRDLPALLASPNDIDALPFGVVVLDADLRVSDYNRAEETLSGLSKAAVLGRPFFTEVAPCMNNYLIADRFRSSETTDETISYVLSVRMRPTPVRIRVIQDQARGTRALAIEKNEQRENP